MAEWRRFHGANIVGEVRRAGDSEVWEALAWAADHPVGLKRHPHRFAVLTMAFTAADALVRQQFRHECSVGACSNWQIWTGPDGA